LANAKFEGRRTLQIPRGRPAGLQENQFCAERKFTFPVGRIHLTEAIEKRTPLCRASGKMI